MKFNYLFNNKSKKGTFTLTVSETFQDEQSFDDAKTSLITKLNELPLDSIMNINKTILVLISFSSVSPIDELSGTISLNGSTIITNSTLVVSDTIEQVINRFPSTSGIYTLTKTATSIEIEYTYFKSIFESYYTHEPSVVISNIGGVQTITYSVL